MAAFVCYPASPRFRRADGVSACLVSAADAPGALAAVVALVGTGGGSVADWTAVQVSGSDLLTPDVAFDAVVGPVGSADNATWPRLSRGGSFLAGS